MLPFRVFYNGKSLAKILSFAKVMRRFRITIVTDIDSMIKLHINDGSNIRFQQCRRGLYYYDTTSMGNKTNKKQVNVYTFMSTSERKSCTSTEVKSKDP